MHQRTGHMHLRSIDLRCLGLILSFIAMGHNNHSQVIECKSMPMVNQDSGDVIGANLEPVNSLGPSPLGVPVELVPRRVECARPLEIDCNPDSQRA